MRSQGFPGATPGLILLALWMLVLLLQRKLLIQKYEEESQLSGSAAIRNASFIRALPAHMRAAHYAFHLSAIYLMSDARLSRSPNLADLHGRQSVLGWFSRGQQRWIVTASLLACGGLALIVLGSFADWLLG